MQLEKISRQQLVSQVKVGLKPFIGSDCLGFPPATNRVQTTLPLVGDISFH